MEPKLLSEAILFNEVEQMKNLVATTIFTIITLLFVGYKLAHLLLLSSLKTKQNRGAFRLASMRLHNGKDHDP